MPGDSIRKTAARPSRLVTVIRGPDCSHGVSAVEKVRSLAEEVCLEVTVEEIVISTRREAEQHRCLGSPTIRIQGQDVEPAARGNTSFGVT